MAVFGEISVFRDVPRAVGTEIRAGFRRRLSEKEPDLADAEKKRNGMAAGCLHGASVMVPGASVVRHAHTLYYGWIKWFD